MAAYDGVAACPGCSEKDASKVGFVWWGGILMAKILKLAKCNRCGMLYGGESGKDQSKAWIWYFLIPLMAVGSVITIMSVVGLF